MPNAAHLHLLVNHLPVFAPALAIPILVLAILLRKERGLLLAGAFLLVVGAVGGWAAKSSGDAAMDMLEADEDKAWGKQFESARDRVAEHENRADKAMYPAIAAAVLAVIVLVFAHTRPAETPISRGWILLVLAGAVATTCAMGWVGNAGGGIMHREIRGDALDEMFSHK